MSRKCFAPNCEMGLASRKRKFSIFRPPKDEELLAKWRRAVPRADRTMTVDDGLCERHFEERFIVRKWEAVTSSGVKLLDVDRGRPKLTDDAVPTLWPNCPKYLSRVSKPPRIRKERQWSAPVTRPSIPHETEEQEHVLQMIQTEPETTKADSFDYLWENVDNIDLPDRSWSKQAIEYKGFKSLVFTESVVTGRKSHTVNRKQVVWDDTFGMHAYVFNRDLDPEALNGGHRQHSSSVQKVEELLRAFHAAIACRGGPSVKEHAEFPLNCGHVDGLGKWRHNDCALISREAYVCVRCTGLDRALRNRANRKRAKSLATGIGPREMTPDEKVATWKMKCNRERRVKIRLEKRCRYLTEVLKKCQTELSDISRQIYQEEDSFPVETDTKS